MFNPIKYPIFLIYVTLLASFFVTLTQEYIQSISLWKDSLLLLEQTHKPAHLPSDLTDHTIFWLSADVILCLGNSRASSFYKYNFNTRKKILLNNLKEQILNTTPDDIDRGWEYKLSPNGKLLFWSCSPAGLRRYYGSDLNGTLFETGKKDAYADIYWCADSKHWMEFKTINTNYIKVTTSSIGAKRNDRITFNTRDFTELNVIRSGRIQAVTTEKILIFPLTQTMLPQTYTYYEWIIRRQPIKKTITLPFITKIVNVSASNSGQKLALLCLAQSPPNHSGISNSKQTYYVIWYDMGSGKTKTSTTFLQQKELQRIEVQWVSESVIVVRDPHDYNLVDFAHIK